jgi:hypothetical protein
MPRRMRFYSRSTSPSKPRTYIGQWLRATLLSERDLRRQLSQMLNGGRDGWNDDEPAVIEAACELAVRRSFGANYDIREISAFVSEMRARIQQNGTAPGQLEMEAVIRVALGETEVDIGGIRRSELLNIRTVVTGNVCEKLELDKSAIDKLITDSEQAAFDRGWKPPIAD